jgi:hypothetical protein
VLTSTRPPLGMPLPLPLLFCFSFDDVDAAVRVLEDGGVATVHQGYPPHALGGEVRITDPDGNTVLLASSTAAPRRRHPQEPPPGSPCFARPPPRSWRPAR